MWTAEYSYSMMEFQRLSLESMVKDGDESVRVSFTKSLENFFERLIRVLTPPVIVEIGAHEAAFSVSCKKAIPASRVIALEANPVVFARYKSAAEAEGIEYLNKAISNMDGKINISVPLNSQSSEISTMTSILPSQIHSDSKTYEIESVRLDTLLSSSHTVASALWIDVEGATGHVLEGAARTLGSCQAAYVELEPSAHVWAGQMLDREIIQRLATFGLAPVLRDVQRKNWQYNAVFVKETLLRDISVLNEIQLGINMLLNAQ